MKDRLVAIGKAAQIEIIIKKSRFIASAFPVDNEEAAMGCINQVKKEHSRANHNVFAYVINEQIQRYSDDGEPGGTAGKPILEVIRYKGLTCTALVVTRYFGGILLGAGGLVRAYSEAASKAIEKAAVVEKLLYREVAINLDYQWLGPVKYELENSGATNININYGQRVHINFHIRPEKAEAVSKRVVDMTSARAEINTGGFAYL
ncbi:hypothetical protein DCCM_3907 [Desulfocucumis palustris]|uniref:Protein co-occurring with transport systems n=1 Tax=Desulfocucumis palustris TaxID=1898651 RepID=A0A2L2XEL3_9FIRM|nr:YigZ family protein [Desulfocucumis palustris]GBF34787.1 hypothetical protein DCCM_3907 [Desulfocucumis palustris]